MFLFSSLTKLNLKLLSETLKTEFWTHCSLGLLISWLLCSIFSIFVGTGKLNLKSVPEVRMAFLKKTDFWLGFDVETFKDKAKTMYYYILTIFLKINMYMEYDSGLSVITKSILIAKPSS